MWKKPGGGPPGAVDFGTFGGGGAIRDHPEDPEAFTCPAPVPGDLPPSPGRSSPRDGRGGERFFPKTVNPGGLVLVPAGWGAAWSGPDRYRWGAGRRTFEGISCLVETKSPSKEGFEEDGRDSLCAPGAGGGGGPGGRNTGRSPDHGAADRIASEGRDSFNLTGNNTGGLWRASSNAGKGAN